MTEISGFIGEKDRKEWGLLSETEHTGGGYIHRG